MSNEMTPYEKAIFDAGVRSARVKELKERGWAAWVTAGSSYPGIKDREARIFCEAILNYAVILEKRLAQLEEIPTRRNRNSDCRRNGFADPFASDKAEGEL